MIDYTYTEQRVLWLELELEFEFSRPARSGSVAGGEKKIVSCDFALRAFLPSLSVVQEERKRGRERDRRDLNSFMVIFRLSGLCTAESCFEVSGCNVSFRVPRSCDLNDLVSV